VNHIFTIFVHVSCGFQASRPSACSGGLQSLSFCDNFNQSVEGIELPAGLQSLTFGGCFNQKIDKVRGKPSSVMGKYKKEKQCLDFRPLRVVSDTLYMAVCTTVPNYFCCSMFLSSM